MSDIVLEVSNLRVEFPLQGKDKKIAVDNVNFQLKKGEILGIVGESGSGKSVTSLAIMGLIQHPGKIDKKSIIRYYQPQDHHESTSKLVALTTKTASEWTKYRGKEIAMIFQEPMSAFNPVYTIGYQLIEAITLDPRNVNNPEETPKEKAIDLLQQVKVLGSDEELKQEYFKNLLLENFKAKYLAESKETNKTLKDKNDEYEQFKGQYLEGLNGKNSEELKAQYLEENKDKNNNDKILDTKSQNYIKQQKKACLKKYPHEFSGGQLQRVMIAMAISCKPKILIADEPTTALDVTVQKGILELLKGLCKDDNIAMIFISHDLGVINEVADNILVMRNGKVVEKGQKEQILLHPQNGYTQGLLACRPPLHIKVDKLPTVADFLDEEKDTDLSENSDVIYTIIKDQEIKYRTQEAKNKEVLLSVNNLTVEYGKSTFFGLKSNKSQAVKNISFEVYAGETLGLVGESGCGKSTLARTILRLIPAASGNVTFGDYEISKKSMSYEWLRKIRKNMQIVFQNPYNSLNPRLTVGQAIAEPIIIHETEPDSKKRREIVNALLTLVGLEINTYHRYPHEFSGGQRQRICIARALALNPRFLICDESVSALDVSVQAQVLNLLKDLQQKLKLTCIFISHDLSVVKFMSDRIMVMKKGEIVEIGEAENVINNPQEDYTKNLLNSIPRFPEDLKWRMEDTVNINQSI